MGLLPSRSTIFRRETRVVTDSVNELPVLTVDGISKRYTMRLRYALKYGLQDIALACLLRPQADRSLRAGEFWALDGVSLTVGRGEAVGIVGPNGSGKSTLLKLVYGVLKPDRGEVRCRGKFYGLLELGTGLEPRLSGHENIALWAAMQGLSKTAAAKLAVAAADFSELGDHLDMSVQSYSTGMKARLSFALAACSDADLLLIDEVFAVGDEGFRSKCLGFLSDYLAHGGALLLTSHWPGYIQDLCKRTLVLDHGQSVFIGDTTLGIAKLLSMSLPSADDVSGPTVASRTSVSISAVTIGGEDGRPPRTGEPLLIRVCYHSERPIMVTWGFVIWTADKSVRITGDIEPNGIGLCEGEGELACRLLSLPLLPGRYRLGVVILHERSFNQIIGKGMTDGGIPFEVSTDPSPKLNVLQSMRQLITIDAEWLGN